MQAVYSHGAVTTVDHTPDSAIAAGAVVVLEDMIGVARSPIPAGSLGSLAVSGCFLVQKAGSDAIDQGESVYWDDDADVAGTDTGTGAITSDNSTGPAFGFAAADAGENAPTILAWLNQAAIPAS